MRAVVTDEYGGPAVLAVRHVEVGQQVFGYARKDFVGSGALDASDELLRTPGRVVSVRDPQAAEQRGGTYVFVRPDTSHLAALAELVDAGRLHPHIQSVHDLEAVTEAVTEAGSGKVRGKVVIRVRGVDP